MPNAPETYRPPSSGSKEQADSFKRRRDTDADRALYKSYRWRKFRKRLKSQRRNGDEELAHKLYDSGEINCSLREYLEYIASDNPLCVDCLSAGHLMPGRVADHIQRIRDGGAAFDPDNIAFRCDHHHNVKSAKEAHE